VDRPPRPPPSPEHSSQANTDVRMTPLLSIVEVTVKSTHIQVGRSHTSQLLLGYCPICGLIHPTLRTSDACRRFVAAVSPEEESRAWRALKAAVVAAG
jgi:hypothetical protein